MLFSYHAKDGAGRTVTGALDAETERQAAQEIREMGYFPMRLAPQRGGAATLSPQNTSDRTGQASTALNGSAGMLPRAKMSPGRWVLAHLVFPIWSGVGLRDMALMYRQFAAMLGAGVPIYQCLTSLTQQTSNGALRGCLQKITARVQEGEMLTAAMADYPWIFTQFHQAMIAAGEQTGRLDIMMSRLSSALEQEYALRNTIKRETWYPCMTLIASFLVPPIVDVVVYNNWRLYYHEAVMPLVSSALFLLAVFVLSRLATNFKVAYDWLIASLPGIGGAVRMIALARFARALASLYAAGVNIPDALRYAAAATGNEFMARRMLTAIPALQGGHGIAEALMATRIFPPMVVSMLGTGEQTGGLDMTMDKVAEYYEQESATRLHQLSVALGAIAMVIVGIKVAMIVGKFYSGYGNQLNDLMKEDN